MTQERGVSQSATPQLDGNGFGILAVVICYFWVIAAWPSLFTTITSQDRSLSLAHVPAARSAELVGFGGDRLGCQTSVGAIFAMAKGLPVACISLIVADDFRISLGDVFGRYWPETWTHDNPSLIGTGTYGFHPFQRGDDVGSFRQVMPAEFWDLREYR